MSSRPFMQLYVSDYLGDTMHLSCEEHGAYILLLMAMWQGDGTLPAEHKKLARICRVTPTKFKRIAIEVLPYFTETGAHITHGRLKKELQKTIEKSAKRSQAGRKGGLAKSLKDNNSTVANAKQLPKHLPETRYHTESKPKGLQGKTDLPKRVYEAWNALASQYGLSSVRSQLANPERDKNILRRLAECNGSEVMLFEVFKQLPKNPFWIGRGEKIWRADFDWIFKSRANFRKVLEYTPAPQEIQNANTSYQNKSRSQQNGEQRSAEIDAAFGLALSQPQQR